ncbi:MAG: tetratricopeptide repeat protein [Candidatus Micrarchaeia archaeon]
MENKFKTQDELFLSETKINLSNIYPSKSKDINFELEGVKRILFEREGQELEKTLFYSKKYTIYIKYITDILKKELEGATGRKKEEEFITGVWGILMSNSKITFGKSETGFLYECMENYIFDCDTSSILIYDIAKELGMNVNLVLAPSHALIKTDNFYFETTGGAYYQLDAINKLYSYHIILNDNQINAITFNGISKRKEYFEDYKGAVEFCKKTVDLVPNFSDAYFNLGYSQYNLENYTEAIANFEKAIKLNPNDPDFYNGLANTQMKIGKYHGAVESYTKAIELAPKHQNIAFYYSNRSVAKDALGLYKEALKDINMAIKLDPSNEIFKLNKKNIELAIN